MSLAFDFTCALNSKHKGEFSLVQSINSISKHQTFHPDLMDKNPGLERYCSFSDDDKQDDIRPVRC